MFENIIKYENKHPDIDWTGKLTYCKVCGDIVIHIRGEPSDTCSCMQAYIGDNGCSGSSACYVDTKKGSKYLATINDDGIPSSDMVQFGENFKDKYLSFDGRHTVRVTVIKPKNNLQSEKTSEKKYPETSKTKKSEK